MVLKLDPVFPVFDLPGIDARHFLEIFQIHKVAVFCAVLDDRIGAFTGNRQIRGEFFGGGLVHVDLSGAAHCRARND